MYQKKKKEIKIKKSSVYIQLFAFLSQRRPHEIIVELNKLLQVDFKLKILRKSELFSATNHLSEYIFFSGKEFPEYQSDYLLAVISSENENIDLSILNEMKKNQLFLGVYSLSLNEKQKKEMLRKIR